MAKNNFLSWSKTASDNADVGGINIAEGCPAPNVNNGMRETMAQLRRDVDPGMRYVVKTGNYTAVANDTGAVHRYTATATLSLSAASILGANWAYVIMADGGDVTIDPNGAELINGESTLVLPDGYTTAVICDGSNFRAFDGFSAIEAKQNALQPFEDVASAATTDIGAAPSQNIRITGTTTITSLGTAEAGTFRRLRFAGAVTLTYNGASLILQRGTSITTTANATIEAISLGGGVWFCLNYEAPGEFFTRWVEYTPVFVGFGTPTNVKFRSRRVGSCLEVEGSFTSGSSTIDTGSASLGFNGVSGGLSIDSFWTSAVTVLGPAATTVVGAQAYGVLGVGGDGVLKFGANTASGRAGLTPIEGSGLIASGDTIAFRASVPIQGWQ